MKKAIALILIFSEILFATPAWYFGKITRVWNFTEGSFIITFDSTSLDNCKDKYVYFNNKLSQVQLQSNLSVALSAFHANSKIGVVIDKTNDGDPCYAMSIDIRK